MCKVLQGGVAPEDVPSREGGMVRRVRIKRAGRIALARGVDRGIFQEEEQTVRVVL